MPICDCHKDGGPVGAYDQPGGRDGKWRDAIWRAENGIPRGQRVPLDAKTSIRWKCPNGLAHHKLPPTRPDDNPALFTLFPRTGDSRMALWRRALNIRRMGIESMFARLESETGVGGEDFNHLRIDGDAAVEWAIGLAFVRMQAAALVQESGLYDQVQIEAKVLGLLDLDDGEDPPSGFKARARRATRASGSRRRRPRRARGATAATPTGTSRSTGRTRSTRASRTAARRPPIPPAPQAGDVVEADLDLEWF